MDLDGVRWWTLIRSVGAVGFQCVGAPRWGVLMHCDPVRRWAGFGVRWRTGFQLTTELPLSIESVHNVVH